AAPPPAARAADITSPATSAAPAPSAARRSCQAAGFSPRLSGRNHLAPASDSDEHPLSFFIITIEHEQKTIVIQNTATLAPQRTNRRPRRHRRPHPDGLRARLQNQPRQSDPSARAGRPRRR